MWDQTYAHSELPSDEETAEEVEFVSRVLDLGDSGIILDLCCHSGSAGLIMRLIPPPLGSLQAYACFCSRSTVPPLRSWSHRLHPTQDLLGQWLAWSLSRMSPALIPQLQQKALVFTGQLSGLLRLIKNNAKPLDLILFPHWQRSCQL